MRLTNALALLSFVSGSTSLSTGGQSHRSNRPERTQASPVSSEKSASVYSTDVFAEVGTSKDSQKRKPRKLQRPPLVDSALLRFLSKQKQLKEQSNINSIGGEVDSLAAPYSINFENSTQQETLREGFTISEDFAEELESLDQLRQQSQTLTQVEQQRITQSQQSDADSTSQSPVQDSLAAQASPQRIPVPADSWMGQFNRNRVAQLLLAIGDGLDEEMAKAAGESVQSHLLARTARRRVREFLKERDSMWVQGMKNGEVVDFSSDTTAGAAQSKLEQQRQSFATSSGWPRQQPGYGFADVVELLIESGLTAKDIAEILIHTPSIALMMPRRAPENDLSDNNNSDDRSSEGETLEETLNRALSDLLCGTLKLRRYDARKVLRNCPGLLTKGGSQSAQNIVEAMSRLGVSASSIARDKNALPTLLSRSPAALFRLIAFLSSDAIRMPLDKIGPLIRRAECLEILNEVAPVSPRLGQGLSVSSSEELLPAFASSVMEQRRKRIDAIYSQMSSTAWTLRNEIGTRDLGKVIAAYPSVLLLDAKEQILPVATFLMDELGIWEDDLPRVLQLYPVLLGMPVSKFEKVIAFITEQGVEEENLSSIFRSFPSLLTLDVEKDMIPVVDFLRSIGINNVGRFISRLPPILGYSVERELVPKWKFISDIYTYESFELSKFPAFFSYPLERVIKARFEYLRDVKRLPTPLIAPDLVLRYGDKDFAQKVAGDDDEGAAFAAYLKERQKTLPSGNGRKNNNTRRPKKVDPKSSKN